MLNIERIRQIESKAVRKLKHPTKGEKLRAFIDSLSTEPSPEDKKKGLRMPVKSQEFWNEGDAYSKDTTEWFRYAGLTPAGVVEWLRINPNVGLGRAHFILMEVPLFLQEWLEFLIASGHPEEAVVETFKDFLLAHDFTFRQSVSKALRKPGTKDKQPLDALGQYMAKMLAGMSAERWPDGLVNFVESTAQDVPGVEKRQGMGA